MAGPLWTSPPRAPIVYRPRARTPWPFLHNGVGCTAFIVFKAADEDLGLLLDTGGLHSGGVGCSLYYDDSGATEGRIQAVVRNGGSTIINIAGATAAANAYPAATWHILRYSYLEGRTNEAQLFGNGCFHIGGDSSGAPSAANPFAALRVGLDVDATAGFGLGGSIGAVILYNRILTDAECRQVENYLSLEFLVPVGNVAVMGDSILAGFNVSRIPATTLASRLGPMWRATNFAVSGSFIDNATDVMDAQWLHTTAGVRRRGYNWMVVMVGINDLKNLASSAATAFALLQTLYASILADPNNRLVVCTLTPFKGDSGYTVGIEAERIALNNLIRGYATTTANTYLVDTAAVLADPADPESIWAPYLFDYLHPNQAGTDAMAAAIGDKLLAIGLG